MSPYDPANLPTILEHRFRGLSAGYDVWDEGDGAGPKILAWDAAYMGREAPTEQELTTWEPEAARWAKQAELEVAFDRVAEAQLGPRPYLGLMIYLELPNDPRSQAVKAARANFNAKTQALADLGRPGRPALTLANIAGIVW